MPRQGPACPSHLPAAPGRPAGHSRRYRTRPGHGRETHQRIRRTEARALPRSPRSLFFVPPQKTATTLPSRITDSHSPATPGAALRVSERGSRRVGFMKNLTTLGSALSGPPVPFTDQLRLAVAAYLAASRAPRVSTPNRTCAATYPGAPSTAWTRWPPSARTWSSTSGGCRKSAGSGPPRYPAGSRSQPGSTGLASWTACWSIRPLSTCAAPRCPPNRRPWDSPTCSPGRCSPPPGSRRTGMTSRW